MTALDLSDLTARLGAETAGREDLVGRVCGILRSEIVEGRLAAGTRLPSEIEFAKAMRVSRPTLREAARILAQEGLLDIRHGIGTFVAAPAPHLSNPLDTMISLSASIRAAGGEPRTRSLVIEQVTAQRDVSLAFGFVDKTDVIRIRRVRLMDDKPVGLSFEYLHIVPPIDLDAVQRFDGSSLYSFILRTLGLDLLRSEMAVTAVTAGAQQARLLAVKPGSPLLLMREMHFGKADRRILYSINYHNSAVVDLTLVRAGVCA